MTFSVSPLVRGSISPAARLTRLLLFAAWLALVAWLAAGHVFWRDEVRAYSLALSGSNFVEMLRNVHGEGHPALWYIMLRAGHDLFPVREVLPVAAALVGIAAMALVAFTSPFRVPIVAAVLFSSFGAFEYVVVARNYGIAALVMFALAALYPRIRTSLWFGTLLLILCNTNVPSCIIAASFLLFRLIEMLSADLNQTRRAWLIFAGNAVLALGGAILCFLTVYPTFNDQAVSSNFGLLGAGKLADALLDAQQGFSHFGFGSFYYFGHRPWQPLDIALLSLCCLGLVRSPAGLLASLFGFVGLKLFFFLIYPSAYRHEALFFVFLLALHWMTAGGAGGNWPRDKRWLRVPEFVGVYVFIALLAFQSVRLVNPIVQRLNGIPYSRSADVGRLLELPELSRAIVVADPDTMAEPIAYYSNNPLWFLRQQRFGSVVRLRATDRRYMPIDAVLSDAERLHRQTGRPIVFLTHHPLETGRPEHYVTMYDDETAIDPQSVARFRSSTRMVGRLWPAGTDETYEVYVYPRSTLGSLTESTTR